MKRNWNEEQKELFELSGASLRLPRVAVSADAGSGKTSTLVERIKVIFEAETKKKIQAKKESSDQAFRVLCVSFTERSKADLEERLFDLAECEIYTIHGFCARVVQEFGARLGLPPEFAILSAEDDEKLVSSSFMKVYRRRPLPSSLHSPLVYFEAAVAYCEKRVSGARDLTVEAPTTEDWSSFFDDVFEEYSIAKEQQGVLSYSDLEYYANEILKFQEVQNVYEARYQHVFVDEFQDTSEIQASIIRVLAKNEKPLFIVGDEKQSIYRFRGADVKVFEKFSEDIGTKRRLSQNYRSAGRVVDAVNRVSSPLFESYHQMQSGRVSTEAAGRAVKVICETEALGIVAAIAEIEASGGSRSNTVLLLRKLSGKKKLFEELKRLGVSLSFAGGSGGHMREDFLELIHLWISVLQPWRTFAKLKTLFAFRHELAFDASRYTEDGDSTFEAFRQGLPVGTAEDLLSALNERLQLKRRYAQAFEEFRLYVLQHLTLNLRPQTIASRFSELLQTGRRWKNLIHFPPPPELQGALRVMTVHGSKGLEFPHVILGDLIVKPPNIGAWLLGKNTLYFADRDEEGDLVRSEKFEQAVSEESEAERNESARLLYVAMTRAMDGLYATFPKNVRNSKHPRWLDWVGEGIEDSVECDGLHTAQLQQQKRTDSNLAGTAAEKESSSLRFVSTVPVRARIGVLDYLSSLREQSVLIDSPKVRTIFEGEAGSLQSLPFREIGTSIHSFLQFEDWEKLREFAVNEKLNLKRFFEWLATEEGSKIFPARADASVEIHREFALDWRMNSQSTLAGRIDRLMVWKEKKEAWIIDYKVVFSQKTPDEFMAEYREQLELYRQAIALLDPSLSTHVFLLDVTARTGCLLHKLSL